MPSFPTKNRAFIQKGGRNLMPCPKISNMPLLLFRLFYLRNGKLVPLCFITTIWKEALTDASISDSISLDTYSPTTSYNYSIHPLLNPQYALLSSLSDDDPYFTEKIDAVRRKLSYVSITKWRNPIICVHFSSSPCVPDSPKNLFLQLALLSFIIKFLSA